MAKINNVLFFCAGNTCRSPFAHYFSNWLKENDFKEELKDVEFDSAGIYHYYKTAQPGTINYLKLKGIDITNFRTRRIDANLLERYDLILGFEQKHHINKLKRKFKHIEDLDKKTFLLLEFAEETENLEIEDPFHLDQENYFKILKRIEDGVIKAIRKIIRINKFEET
ncbi:MAG: hypothetical protein KGD65_10240 [Candidatus Lokiarchaeota archaeon]|nr:hypothetical protein [Candidatus Lokiarchaeota archaeon]